MNFVQKGCALSKNMIRLLAKCKGFAAGFKASGCECCNSRDSQKNMDLGKEKRCILMDKENGLTSYETRESLFYKTDNEDVRLREPENFFGKGYFEEQLERIRDIRSSERRFYQKITDIYSQCSADYDVESPITKAFFQQYRTSFTLRSRIILRRKLSMSELTVQSLIWD